MLACRSLEVNRIRLGLVTVEVEHLNGVFTRVQIRRNGVDVGGSLAVQDTLVINVSNGDRVAIRNGPALLNTATPARIVKFLDSVLLTPSKSVVRVGRDLDCARRAVIAAPSVIEDLLIAARAKVETTDGLMIKGAAVVEVVEGPRLIASVLCVLAALRQSCVLSSNR